MKLKNIKVNYTIVPNEWLRSKLSFKAVGLIVILQSLPDNWDFSIAGLAKLTNCKRSSIASALKELEEAGFVERKQSTINGRFSHISLELKANKSVDFPSAEKPSTDFPSAENGSQLNKEKQNKEEQSKENNKDTNVSLGKSKLLPMEAPAKKEYGKKEINQMFDEWENAFSYRPKDSQANRFAISNMLKNKQIGYQKLSGIIKALPKLQAKRFCLGNVKGVSDFESLQRNWDAVWAMALREYQNQQAHKFSAEDLKI